MRHFIPSGQSSPNSCWHKRHRATTAEGSIISGTSTSTDRALHFRHLLRNNLVRENIQSSFDHLPMPRHKTAWPSLLSMQPHSDVPLTMVKYASTKNNVT